MVHQQPCISHFCLFERYSYLTAQFHAGHGYRSLNVYRSAISSIHPKLDGYGVGSHPLVCRLLKGVFNKRPPLPKYHSTWSVESVIAYVSSMGPNNSLCLKQLTHKLAILRYPRLPNLLTFVSLQYKVVLLYSKGFVALYQAFQNKAGPEIKSQLSR